MPKEPDNLDDVTFDKAILFEQDKDEFLTWSSLNLFDLKGLSLFKEETKTKVSSKQNLSKYLLWPREPVVGKRNEYITNFGAC